MTQRSGSTLHIFGESAVTLIYSRAKPSTVVVVTRPDQPSLYSLPGGKREAGETLAEAAMRELYEETRLRAVALQPVFMAPSVGELEGRPVCRLTTTFLCVADGDPEHTEHHRVAWIDPDSLRNPDVSPFYRYYRMLFMALTRAEVALGPR